MSESERRDGAAELFEEFMGEVFDVFDMGDELRGRHRREFGVVLERGGGHSLGRGEFEIEREQPARGERDAQRHRDEGEPSFARGDAGALALGIVEHAREKLRRRIAPAEGAQLGFEIVVHRSRAG